MMSNKTPSNTPTAGQEGPDNVPNTGNTGTNENNAGSPHSAGNRNRNRSANQNNYNRNNNMQTFEGVEPSVRAVLGLASERINKKVSFEQFKEKEPTLKRVLLKTRVECRTSRSVLQC